MWWLERGPAPLWGKKSQDDDREGDEGGRILRDQGNTDRFTPISHERRAREAPDRMTKTG